jgi:uncharacterized LabA/DUF88 family protein
MKAVGVFADVSNQFFSVATTFKGAKVNYTEYLKTAVGDNELYRAFAYGVQVSSEATPFIASLQRIGYDTRYKLAKVVDGKPSIPDTNWNVGIVIDMIRHLDRLDVVVIGSNNPDLIPAINFIRDRGVKVIIYSCRIPKELKDAADGVIEITADILERRPAPAE